MGERMLRHRLSDLPARLRSPLGRRLLLMSFIYHGWPFLARPAALYRRTLARSTRVVAVTGSFGKTTAARAIETALGGQAPATGYRNAHGFVALTVLRIRPGQRHKIIEIGLGGPNEMESYASVIRPDVAVVTSIGSEHNRSFGSLEVTRNEKAHLVRALSPSGIAVLNGDDPNVRWMRGETRARVVTYGFADGNDVRADAPVLDWPHGMRVRIFTREGTHDARVRLVGRPMVYPILAAMTVALEEGVAPEQAIAALEALEPTPGRLQPVPLPSGAILLRDDFKSAEETIDVALDLAAEIPAARRIVVLGDVSEPVGSQGPIYRRLGERVGRVASRAIFLTGSASNAGAYAAGAGRGGLPRQGVLKAKGGVRQAVDALRDLGPGDVVLIKGRDTQHLERIALALQGRRVKCELASCSAKLPCVRCPMLKRGWTGLGVVTRG
jgi:UDP-N-acetylmuramoyl-tripeptide--D-alanyl-D-alanine ligase